MVHPAPRPLSPHIFALTLQYLLPPTPPLPTHLISNALMQRHYFLNIDPTSSSDPAAYFLWPRSSTSGLENIINTLEQIASQHDVDTFTPDDVEYVVDEDTAIVHAKVGLAEQLQVIFALDGGTVASSVPSGGDVPSEWRYHDVVWRQSQKGGYQSFQAALDAFERLSLALNDDTPEEDVGKQVEDFWGGWDDEPTPQVPKNPSSIPGSQDDDGAYFSRHDDTAPVIHDTTQPSSKAGSIFSLRAESELPQIPTEGYNTPAEEKESYPLRREEDSGRTPMVFRARPLYSESDPDPNVGAADEAAIGIIRGAYHLWNATRVHPDSESFIMTKAEFLQLVNRAISE